MPETADTTEEEKKYYEENARCILTIWGQKDTQLNDYANRGWAGLTKGSIANVGNVLPMVYWQR